MNTMTTYKISDHPNKADVIRKHQGINVDDREWYEAVLDDWKGDLERLGYSDPDIQFSGFWGQGDGASFTASSVPPHTEDPEIVAAWELIQRMTMLAGGQSEWELEAIGPLDQMDLEGMASGSVYRHGHRYVHENTVSVDWQFDDFPNTTGLLLEDQWDALEQAIKSYYENLDTTVTDLCREIYADLEKEYEYQTSDEAVEQALESYELDEDGDIV
jgi:hypothetical protein